MTTINASHILVKTESEAKNLLQEINSKKIIFEEAAKRFSLCPSKSQGGSLGDFTRGMMVPEFDTACFNPKNKSGDILGPIRTEFGFHLIKINSIN